MQGRDGDKNHCKMDIHNRYDLRRMAEMTCLQIRRAVLKLRKAIKADREPLDDRRIAEIDCAGRKSIL